MHSMMTPAKKQDGWMWSPLPAWLKAALVWGPLGVVFSLVCWAAVLLFCDARTEMKGWFQTQKEAISKQSDSLEKVSTAFQVLVEGQRRSEDRFAQFHGQVTAQHGALVTVADQTRQAIEQNQVLIEQGNTQSKTNTEILNSATEMMTGAPERAERMISLLEVMADQKQSKTSPNPNDGT